MSGSLRQRLACVDASGPSSFAEMKPSPLATWHVTGATVRGAIHVRRGVPNQDAIAWHAPADIAAPRIVALADGHGAALHVRSHHGARFAVRAAVETLLGFAEASRHDDLPAVEERAAERLSGEITAAWQAFVSDDLARRPLTNWEHEALAGVVPESSLARLEHQPHIAYGSTVIAALLTRDYALLLQLGDGDILEVFETGDVRHAPLAADPLLHGNETTSLCSPDAGIHMRVAIEPIDAEGPRCFMLSTDGYANSFVDAHGLEQAATDLYALTGEIGMLEVGRALPDWLRATSAQGSGDDITVGLAVRHPSS